MVNRAAKKTRKTTTKIKTTVKKKPVVSTKKTVPAKTGKAKQPLKAIAKSLKTALGKLAKPKKTVKPTATLTSASHQVGKSAKPISNKMKPGKTSPSSKAKASPTTIKKLTSSLKKLISTANNAKTSVPTAPAKLTVVKTTTNPSNKEPKKMQKQNTSHSPASQITSSSRITTMGIPPYEPSGDEEYMNSAQREHFRKILMAWKQQLMEEVDRTVHHMQDEAANFPDPNDRATQEEEFSLELRARDRERKLIKKIDEALQKIDHDEYGYCETCGVEIGIRRLEARPTATLCIDCKTIDEIREKNYT